MYTAHDLVVHLLGDFTMRSLNLRVGTLVKAPSLVSTPSGSA